MTCNWLGKGLMAAGRLFFDQRSFLAVIVALAVVGMATGSWADDAERTSPEPQAGWEPYFALGFDVQIQSLDASFESDTIPTLYTPVDPETGQPLIDPETEDPIIVCCDPTVVTSVADSGSGTVTPPMVGIELGVLSPTLVENKWRPRLFLRARGEFPTTGSRNIKRTNTPILQVSKKIEYSAAYLIGGGIDLELPTDGRRVGLRVSVDYFRIDFRPRVDVDISEVIDPSSPFFTEPVFRGTGSGDRAYQGIAPGLTVEAFLGRRGKLGFSLYSEALAMIILGDRTHSVGVQNEIGSGSGTYRVTADSVAYQVGAGIRVSWQGLGK